MHECSGTECQSLEKNFHISAEIDSNCVCWCQLCAGLWSLTGSVGAPHWPFSPDMSAGPKSTFLLAEHSHGTLLKKAATSSWPEISVQYKVLSHNTSGLKPVGSILILLVQNARLQEELCGHRTYSASGKTGIMNFTEVWTKVCF